MLAYHSTLFSIVISYILLLDTVHTLNAIATLELGTYLYHHLLARFPYRTALNGLVAMLISQSFPSSTGSSRADQLVSLEIGLHRRHT